MAFRRLGPAYGKCVGERDGVWSVDLWQANRLLLEEAGLRPDHIEVTASCVFAEEGSSFPIAATAVIQAVWGPLPSFEKQMGQI